MLVDTLVEQDDFRMLLISAAYEIGSNQFLFLIHEHQLLHDVTLFLRAHSQYGQQLQECVEKLLHAVPEYPVGYGNGMIAAQSQLEQKLSQLPLEKIRSVEWRTQVTNAMKNWIQQTGDTNEKDR